MSAVTVPNAFPYPVGGDNVDDYPALGQLLAEAIDDHVALQKSGAAVSGTLVAGVAKDVAVVFGTPFPAAGPIPTVITGIVNGTSTVVGQPSVTNVTRSGFDLRFIRPSGTASYTAYWYATNIDNW